MKLIDAFAAKPLTNFDRNISRDPVASTKIIVETFVTVDDT